MDTKNSWKQPISPSLRYEFGEDYEAATLFILLLLGAANDERVVMVRNVAIKLKRGQVIFGRYKYARFFNLAPSQAQSVQRILERLQKVHNRINILVKPRVCTVVTILAYDELVGLKHTKQTTDKQQINTNKKLRYKTAAAAGTSKETLQQLQNLLGDGYKEKDGIPYRKVSSGWKKINSPSAYLAKLQSDDPAPEVEKVNNEHLNADLPEHLKVAFKKK